MVAFENSSPIFKAIGLGDPEQLQKEAALFDSDALTKCESGLIRRGKSIRSYNLLEASCLVENEEAFKYLLFVCNRWTVSMLKNAAPLAIAAKKETFVQELIKAGYPLQEALIKSCQVGHHSLVNYLLRENKSEINFSDPSPVLKAAAGGYQLILEALKEYSFDLHANEEEALCVAVRGGHKACVRYLIQMGADVGAQNELAIKTAIINGDTDTFDELLANASDLQKIAKEEYVTLAERYNHPKIVASLRVKLAQMNVAAPINSKQSTHTSSIDKTVTESVKRLQKRYGNALNTQNIAETIKAITLWSDHLPKNKINRAAQRAFTSLLQDTTVHKDIDITLKQLLVLFWVAIHDEVLREGELSEALRMLAEGLYEIQRGYNLLESDSIDSVPEDNDIDICEEGRFNKLMEKLVGIHPDVEIDFITKEVASLKLRAVVKEEFSQFKSRNPLINNNIFPKNDDVNSVWTYIRENVKQRIFEEFSILFKSYNDTEFDEFIDMGIYTNLGAAAVQEPVEIEVPSSHKKMYP